MDPSEYQITIKSANQKVADYVLMCRPGWTVHRLKQHISETHTYKPTVEEQRLIYAGNLLKDNQILKQIFFRDSLCTELTNSNKADFTIHLVCSTIRSTPNDNSHSSRSAGSSSSPSSTISSASTQSVSSSQSGLRLRDNVASRSSDVGRTSPSSPNTSSTQPSTTSNVNPNTNSTVPRAEALQNLLQSDHMQQQLAIFQQLAYVVAAQIADNLSNNNVNVEAIAASRSHLAGRATSFGPTLNGQPLNIHVSSMSNINQLTVPQVIYTGNRPQPQLPTPREQLVGVHPNENLNMDNNRNGHLAEQAGPQFNIEAQQMADQPAPPQAEPAEIAMPQHDVIDWVYYSIRAVVLMAALYIHASMFRLLFIVGLLALAYFFNRRPARRPHIAAARAGNNVANQQRDDLDGVDELNAPQEPNQTGENQQERRRNAGISNRVPFLKLCYLVVTDFLASLVPE